jgi:hypothetical protein
VGKLQNIVGLDVTVIANVKRKLLLTLNQGTVKFAQGVKVGQVVCWLSAANAELRNLRRKFYVSRIKEFI